MPVPRQFGNQLLERYVIKNTAHSSLPYIKLKKCAAPDVAIKPVHVSSGCVFLFAPHLPRERSRVLVRPKHIFVTESM